MSRLEKELRIKLEQSRTHILEGHAPDHAAYTGIMARYHVLKELVDFVDDLRKENTFGDPDTDD